MRELLQLVYPTTNNVANIEVYYVDSDGVESALDLSPVSRVVYTIVGADGAGGDVVVDSSAGGDIVWDLYGNITVSFYGLTISTGQYPCKIKVYDPGHTAGQWIVHPDSESRIVARVVNI